MLPDDVLVVGADELEAGRRAWIHEEVAGRRWRISAESFFQTRPDGAAGAGRRRAVDGGGRAGGAAAAPAAAARCSTPTAASGCSPARCSTARPGWRAVAVERSRSSVADARHNLADLDAKVVTTTVEHLRAPRADLVVADPSRAGLGRAGVHVLASSGAPRLVLVSCDPAVGRSRRRAARRGRATARRESVLVDLFPHTHHTEVVTRFDRD